MPAVATPQTQTVVKEAPIEYARLGPEHFDALFARIQAIMKEVGAHDAASFDKSWWRWQYRDLPTRDARVYGVLRGEEVLAYYHVPIHKGQVGGERRRFGMVQGVAVSPKLRGRGVFRTLAEFATEDLARSDVDLLYTFPNGRSIRTFIKYNGYAAVKTLRPYVLPVRSAQVLEAKLRLGRMGRILGAAVDGVFRLPSMSLERGAALTLHDGIDDEIAEAYAAQQPGLGMALVRDRAYLTWRFVDRPNSRHLIFSLRSGGETRAAAIFKRDELFGVPALILMDYACPSGGERHVLQLLSEIKRRPRRYVPEPFALIFTAGSGPLFRRLPRIGFVPVPERFNPRPLTLLARGADPERDESVTSPEAWHATLADWDVF